MVVGRFPVVFRLKQIDGHGNPAARQVISREKLQKLIDEYNSGSLNIDLYFKELVKMTQDLNEEDQRAVSEGLSEQELAVFDLLTKPEISLTEKERAEIKKITRDLLNTLKKEKLVLDWRKRQASTSFRKGYGRRGIGPVAETYTGDMQCKKCNIIYRHIYDHYYGQGRSIYDEVS